MSDTIEKIKLIGKLQFIRDYECKTDSEVKAMCEAIRILSESPAQPQDKVLLDKEAILQAGYQGKEVEFYIGGRLFAIREKAQ